MNKTLILIRHGHRDTANRTLDNGLSEKGFKQARRLREFAALRFVKTDLRQNGALLLTSPKRRCLETLEPLAKWSSIEIQARLDLEERRSGESSAKFQERVSSFLGWWIKDAPSLCFASTHGDWLPAALEQVLGCAIEIKKGGWVELELCDGRPQLRWYIPSFKYFFSPYRRRLNSSRIPSRRE